MADSRRFPVRFDDEAFAEDCDHATSRGKEVAEGARERLEQEGIPPGELRACEAGGQEGTRLPGCVKTYLPPPDGRWGMVLTGDTDTDGAPVLVYLAFGERHPRRPWQLSVYQVAHRRLHAAPGDGSRRLPPRG
jgi:hypothetical protein